VAFPPAAAFPSAATLSPAAVSGPAAALLPAPALLPRPAVSPEPAAFPPAAPVSEPASFPGAGPALRWRRVFPGHEAELRQVRFWLAELLPGVPAREDVLTVAIELAANAVRHTASGWNGFFAVEITWQAQPATVRIAVADGGARTSPRLSPGADPLREDGRGLRVVRALATRTGMCGDERGRLVWADVRWAADGPAPPEFPAGYEAALRDIHTVLAARYPEAAIWFGRATMQWWAMSGDPPGGQLVTAQSPAELAGLLEAARRRPRPARRFSRGRHGVTGRRASPRAGRAAQPGRAVPRSPRVVPSRIQPLTRAVWAALEVR
jgi:serine/threonine-protein kinase RsbW